MNTKKSIPVAAAPSFSLTLPFNQFLFKRFQSASIILQAPKLSLVQDLYRNWPCCMEKISCITLPMQYFNFIVLILAINSKNNLWAAKRCSSDIHRGFYFVLVICFVFFF